MRHLFSALLLSWCLLPTAVRAAGTEPWIEVRSPHFTVLTNSNAHDGRMVAEEFEQMRSVFARTYPKITLDSGAPLTIFAARDEETMRHLLPGFYKMKNASGISGTFSRRWEKQFAWVRLDQWGEDAHQVVYHEYTHSVMHQNLHWMPIWMDEGLAEFYGFTRFEQKRIYIGAPTERYPVLRRHPMMPISELLMVDARSPWYHVWDKVDLFYAESWALVHYLTLGPGADGGLKLMRYDQLLETGTPPLEAFRTLFGDPAEVDKELQRYVMNFTLKAAAIPTDANLDERSFAERKLTTAETEAAMGAFEVGEGEVGLGRQHLEAAVAADPNLGSAHEEIGFLLLRQGKDAEAQAEFAKAYGLDARLYRSLWAETMMGPEPTTEAEAEARKATLEKVLDGDVRFAPALVEMAQLDMAEGNWKGALGLSRRAEQLEPSRAGYHLLSARALLAAGNGKQAAQFAEFVAGRWHGPDHDEAVELWNQVPKQDRTPGVTLMEEAPPGTVETLGIVKEVQCGTGEDFKLVLDVGGKPVTYSTHEPFGSGFSDTLWYGEDHFTVCHHLEGHRAVVFAKPGGQMMAVHFRVDPPAPFTAAAQQQAVVAPQH